MSLLVDGSWKQVIQRCWGRQRRNIQKVDDGGDLGRVTDPVFVQSGRLEEKGGLKCVACLLNEVPSSEGRRDSSLENVKLVTSYTRNQSLMFDTPKDQALMDVFVCGS